MASLADKAIREIEAGLELQVQLDQEVYPDHQERMGKLDKMVSTRKQLRTVRALNRIASAFPGLVKKREPPKVTRNTREKIYVGISDIISVLRKLFDLRTRRTVHLAIDLYLILISSQRFLADRQRIMVGVLDML